MAPKKNNAVSDSAQNDSNNNSSQQRQNTDANNNLIKEKTSNSQRIGGDGPRMSRSKKAGVIFPVLQILRRLKGENRGKLVQNATAVYMAGVLEYLVAEVVELAGNAASENKRKRITPRHIYLAIQNDEELNKVCENVTIASGGVLPHIHEVLLQTKHSSQSSRKRSSQSRNKSQDNSTGASADSMDD